MVCPGFRVTVVVPSVTAVGAPPLIETVTAVIAVVAAVVGFAKLTVTGLL
jgi:hypothetical protein